MTWTEAARERCRDDGRRTPSDLTDAEWRRIEPVPRGYAVLKVDLRERVARLSPEKAGSEAEPQPCRLPISW